MGIKPIPQAVSTQQRTSKDYARQQDYYMELVIHGLPEVPSDDAYGVAPRKDCDASRGGEVIR